MFMCAPAHMESEVDIMSLCVNIVPQKITGFNCYTFLFKGTYSGEILIESMGGSMIK